MADTYTIVRSLHLLFAVLWGGGSLYHGLIVMGGFMDHNAEARKGWYLFGRFGPYFGITSLLTLVFGLWTYFLGGPYSSGENAVLGLGMLGGAIGVIIGYAGHLPTMAKIAKAHKAGDAETAAAMEAREHRLDKASMVVVGIAWLSMTTFRLFG